jgi:hypothetical protein
LQYATRETQTHSISKTKPCRKLTLTINIQIFSTLSLPSSRTTIGLYIV